MLGVAWKKLTEEEKETYKKESKRLRIEYEKTAPEEEELPPPSTPSMRMPPAPPVKDWSKL